MTVPRSRSDITGPRGQDSLQEHGAMVDVIWWCAGVLGAVGHRLRCKENGNASSRSSLSSQSLSLANHISQLLDSTVSETATLNYSEQSKTSQNKVIRTKQARDGPRTKSPGPETFTKIHFRKSCCRGRRHSGHCPDTFPH